MVIAYFPTTYCLLLIVHSELTAGMHVSTHGAVVLRGAVAAVAHGRHTRVAGADEMCAAGGVAMPLVK